MLGCGPGGGLVAPGEVASLVGENPGAILGLGWGILVEFHEEWDLGGLWGS
jgi:hypothetical protein